MYGRINLFTQSKAVLPSQCMNDASYMVSTVTVRSLGSCVPEKYSDLGNKPLI